ncbi:hypothetical protein BEWA_033150 [Theileria equi strain WA]|uniref:Uncharacterized protein n=1 Tax=Theileria equi strain WA TaxID=1537102 RepID=L0AY06_THEEQ|nr:hypothetical protein BEWA_033150 [Theileria equi strain WA]AFZ80462.1 hypothetical protein BEWA_033150 [Theileria equi strain WA]|eukprot:XP_004830128.1 hypothetical protein BEWA_033150 [Theileria equi strain WA]
MIHKKSTGIERIKSLFRSLEINRQLSCGYIKQFAETRNLILNGNNNASTLESEGILIGKLETNTKESIEDLKHAEEHITLLERGKTTSELAILKETLKEWKRDVVLRIVLTSNLVSYSTRLFMSIVTTRH